MLADRNLHERPFMICVVWLRTDRCHCTGKIISAPVPSIWPRGTCSFPTIDKNHKNSLHSFYQNPNHCILSFYLYISEISIYNEDYSTGCLLHGNYCWFRISSAERGNVHQRWLLGEDEISVSWIVCCYIFFTSMKEIKWICFYSLHIYPRLIVISLAFGDSYTYVQGTRGRQNYSFIGDEHDNSFTPSELLSDEIVQNQVCLLIPLQEILQNIDTSTRLARLPVVRIGLNTWRVVSLATRQSARFSSGTSPLRDPMFRPHCTVSLGPSIWFQLLTKQHSPTPRLYCVIWKTDCPVVYICPPSAQAPYFPHSCCPIHRDKWY